MPEFSPTHTDETGDITAFECVPRSVLVSDFVRHYLIAAEWTDCNSARDQDTSADPESSEYDPSAIGFAAAKGWSSDAVEKAVTDCDSFLKLVGSKTVDGVPLLDAYYDAGGTDEQMGHDFWLTRNGHGAGFWDRGLGVVGDMMTECAKASSGVDMYVGDDALLYF